MTLSSLSAPPTHDEVQAVFEQYAAAYALMESFQHPESKAEEHARLLPTGDQKTGCIGEYWAMRYARKRWPKRKCIFGNHSQHGWDIRVQGSNIRIQVKTVSEHSKSRELSPIHAQTKRPENASDDWARWTHLWLVYLNCDLYPTDFWQLVRRDVEFQGREKLTGLKIRKPAGTNGSTCLKWPKNSVTDLLSPLITAH